MLKIASPWIAPYTKPMLKPSSERVFDLEKLSGRVYPAIDESVGGEPRYRAMLRLGINQTGEALRRGADTETAGVLLLSSMQEQLSRGGVDASAYSEYPEYQKFLQSLPKPPTRKFINLNNIANRYADVPRKTLDKAGEFETDARHAIHLMSLAVPFAMRYYPELRPGHIAIDCLVHDFPEAIVGDTATFGMPDEDYAVKIAEEVDGLPRLESAIGDDYAALFHAVVTYEQQTEPESQYVRRFDKEDPYFTHIYNRGQQLTGYYGIRSAAEFIDKTHVTTARIAKYAGSFPLLAEDRAEFIRLTALRSDWPEA